MDKAKGKGDEWEGTGDNEITFFTCFFFLETARKGLVGQVWQGVMVL